MVHHLREKQLLQPCIILHIFVVVIKYFVQLVHSCLREVNMFAEQKQPLGGVLLKKDVLENFAKFTGKHLCWNLF